MKIFFLLSVVSILYTACIRNSGKNRSESISDNKIKNEIIAVAENYLANQLTEGKKTISAEGIITLDDNQKRYVIEPSKIYTGLIDDDTTEDAIISISTFRGKYQTVSEHLILLKPDDDFMLVTTIESDMRIISVKDRIITADVPEHSRNTPLFDCPSCWEVVKYRFTNGELVRME
ncbi:MAG: hypothetical protein IQL11_00060 [Bacteroidales bacterium]|nr:hypothetical protein [Bacteroidales bacterium]